MPSNFSFDLFKMIRTSYFPRVTTYPLPCNLDCLTCLDCCHIGQLDSHQSNLRKETFDSSSQTKHALGFDITQSHIPGIVEYQRNLANYTNYISSCAQQLVKEAVFWFCIPKQNQIQIHQHISIHSPKTRQKKHKHTRVQERSLVKRATLLVYPDCSRHLGRWNEMINGIFLAFPTAPRNAD